jgi:argininosuccinate lyase
MFARDRERIAQVMDEVNVCPLGSGAIAGTTLPIDREFVATELGFIDPFGEPNLTGNSMDAVADRDGFLDLAHAAALCGLHMSRVAEDMIIWNSAEFAFITLPDAYTTGSSLMPQKKNPDSMELIRGKSARLQGNLHTLYTLVKGLPLTYNRDLQEDKPPLFDSVRQVILCLQVLREALKGSTMNADKCAAAVADPMLLATDLADHLVTHGVPFRKAHHVVGTFVAVAEEHKTPLDKLSDADVAMILAFAQKKVEPLDMFTADDLPCLENALAGGAWRSVFDLERAIAVRTRPGMPAAERSAERIAHWRGELA